MKETLDRKQENLRSLIQIRHEAIPLDFFNRSPEKPVEKIEYKQINTSTTKLEPLFKQSDALNRDKQASPFPKFKDKFIGTTIQKRANNSFLSVGIENDIIQRVNNATNILHDTGDQKYKSNDLHMAKNPQPAPDQKPPNPGMILNPQIKLIPKENPHQAPDQKPPNPGMILNPQIKLIPKENPHQAPDQKPPNPGMIANPQIKLIPKENPHQAPGQKPLNPGMIVNPQIKLIPKENPHQAPDQKPPNPGMIVNPQIKLIPKETPYQAPYQKPPNPGMIVKYPKVPEGFPRHFQDKKPEDQPFWKDLHRKQQGHRDNHPEKIVKRRSSTVQVADKAVLRKRALSFSNTSDLWSFVVEQERRSKLIKETCQLFPFSSTYSDLQNMPAELLIDKEQQVAYCPVFKSASTSWILTFMEIGGYEPPKLDGKKSIIPYFKTIYKSLSVQRAAAKKYLEK
ncbi:hypothetical protein SK128_026249 [Halocaridina rubra]|uniref:Uncharacterized protein n=1 Tax=Halocaridina rubra TaxID=373956 RepID=A0AAN8WEZ5_HALRR